MLGVEGAVPKRFPPAEGLPPVNIESWLGNDRAPGANGDVAVDGAPDSWVGGEVAVAVSRGVIAMLTGSFPALDFRFLACGADRLFGEAGRERVREFIEGLLGFTIRLAVGGGPACSRVRSETDWVERNGVGWTTGLEAGLTSPPFSCGFADTGAGADADAAPFMCAEFCVGREEIWVVEVVGPGGARWFLWSSVIMIDGVSSWARTRPRWSRIVKMTWKPIFSCW